MIKPDEQNIRKMAGFFKVFGDENKLIWTDLRRDFSDPKHYAGEGNIAHMLEHIKMHSKELLGKVIK